MRKSHQQKKSRLLHRGYIVVSQPKYRHLDTVRVKAYITDRKGRPIDEAIDFFIYDGKYKGRYGYMSSDAKPIVQKRVKPNHLKGNYTFDFVVGDSLILDKKYEIRVRKIIKKPNVSYTFFQESFYLEDYELDKIKFSFKPTAKQYTRGAGKIIFQASGKTQNDNFIADGKARITVKTRDIFDFYGKEILVPDTIWQKEIELKNNQITQIILPWDDIPNVKMELSVKAELYNSNGEYHSTSSRVKVDNRANYATLELKDSSIIATYKENNQVVPKKGILLIHSINGQKGFLEKKEIELPHQEKFNPNHRNYILQVEGITQKRQITEQDNAIFWTGWNEKDSVQLRLSNVRRIPIRYRIYELSKLVAEGRIETDSWTFKNDNLKHFTYQLEYSYLWQGERITKRKVLTFQKNKLSFEINQPTEVLPGEKVTIKIKATDEEEEVAPNVNLTAFAITSAFNEQQNYSLPTSPKPRYKRPTISKQFGIRAIKDKDFSKSLNRIWYQKMGLKALDEYRICFPENGVLIETHDVSAIDSFYQSIAQVAPYIVKNGLRQDVKLIYINNELVYYHDAARTKPYAFIGETGYNQLQIRTYKYLYTIDSLFLEKGQKLEISIDEDIYKQHPFGKHISREIMPEELTIQEKTILDHTMFFFEKAYPNKFNIYLTQGDENIHFMRSERTRPIGPFNGYSQPMKIVVRGKWQETFEFESGFRYAMTPDRDRLYKHNFFAQDKEMKLSEYATYQPKYGQLVFTPSSIVEDEIFTFKDVIDDFLFLNRIRMYEDMDELAAFKYEIEKETAKPDYWLEVWFQDNILKRVAPIRPQRNTFHLPAGDYNLVVFRGDSTYFEQKVTFKSDTLTYKRFLKEELTLKKDTNFIFLKTIVGSYPKDTIYKEGIRQAKKLTITRTETSKAYNQINGQVFSQKTSQPIQTTIQIIAITYQSEVVPNSEQIIRTNKQGFFKLENIKAGKYKVVFNSKNHRRRTVYDLYINNSEQIDIKVFLFEIDKKMARNEFFDIGLDSKSMNNKSYSIVERLEEQSNNSINGMVATAPGASSTDKIYIDGIVARRTYEQLEESMNEEYSHPTRKHKTAKVFPKIATEEVDDNIFTENEIKITIRKRFQDYAFWQPNLITDQNGETFFTVQFPDDITQWNTTVVGMDDRLRNGIGYAQTQAFKPVMGQLALPRFLIEGDKTNIIGKSINYTLDTFNISTQFSQNGEVIQRNQTTLTESFIENTEITAMELTDSLKLQYQLMTEDFGDGEERVIPVFRKGVEETKGIFCILEGDTTIRLSFDENMGNIQLYARANLLDVLLKDIEYLKNYEYGCNEQTASRLMALLLEKRIKSHLNEPFEHEEHLLEMIARLQSTQNENGSWGWWNNNQGTTWMTNYVTKALYQAHQAGYSQGKSNVDKALKYISNIRAYYKLSVNQKINTLNLLVDLGQNAPFKRYIKELDTLELSLYQQLVVTKVKQHIDLPYDLDTLDQQMNNTTFGGKYWGNYNYSWYDNSTQLSIIAHDIYQKANRTDICKGIRQYLLEKRQHIGWRNTFETAQILDLILPELLGSSSEITKSTITLNDNQPFDLHQQPFQATLTNNDLTIKKTGTAPVYLTASQAFHNQNPTSKSDIFEVKSVLKQATQTFNQTKVKLEKNKLAYLVTTVEVKAAADYVMIEIPIPAGCSYTSKSQENKHSEVHREYFKHKMSIFCRSLPPGTYTFKTPLEVRYEGEYTLNAAKVEQMYFPVFYGRNENKTIKIR